ncbi:ribosomal protein L9 [Thermodesulfatator indicus DSM 15286]|uniref:Large ribosomal subunit protein bL9 n=1 Tax=Thermodesulfatator indicus (strain DSM 15286 / JCM 11887 / CIR29812) TaxID=667014 RepID=F8AB89_THEID|nr:50S ribosomal protein L9 [Thermodesulfatator indicus]AEH45546.1 ribosomal protein L9 [Thermodesulfatator indicus DSM 15286]
MQVILKEYVPNLGAPGDVVTVKPGYARNYLIPKGLAIPASKKSLKAIERERQIILAKAERIRRKLMSEAERLNEVELEIPQRVVEEDRLYGSVSATEIVNALKEKGFEIAKKQVLLEEPIKKLGEYVVPIKLSADVTAHIKVKVVPLS